MKLNYEFLAALLFMAAMWGMIVWLAVWSV